MTRPRVVIGNWKLNPSTLAEALDLARDALRLEAKERFGRSRNTQERSDRVGVTQREHGPAAPCPAPRREALALEDGPRADCLAAGRAKLEQVSRPPRGQRAACEKEAAQVGPPAAGASQRRMRIAVLGAVREPAGGDAEMGGARKQRREHLPVACAQRNTRELRLHLLRERGPVRREDAAGH